MCIHVCVCLCVYVHVCVVFFKHQEKAVNQSEYRLLGLSKIGGVGEWLADRLQVNATYHTTHFFKHTHT